MLALVADLDHPVYMHNNIHARQYNDIDFVIKSYRIQTQQLIFHEHNLRELVNNKLFTLRNYSLQKL